MKRAGTGPFSKFRRGKDYCLLGGRVHVNDSKELKARLKAQKLNYSEWLRAVIEAYLTADPELMRIVSSYVERTKIRPAGLDDYSFSPRERKKIEMLISAGGGDDDGEAV